VLSQWIIDSLGSLDEQLMRNAWNGPGFSDFNYGMESDRIVAAGNVEGKALDLDDDEFGDVLIFAA
jgi:hypothetical protein